jgi:REP element-mobilizing transposase RayT
MPDHVHFLIGMRPACCLSDLVREVKKSSSLFIKARNSTAINFQWQEGYGAFSYSHSSLNHVVRYIMNQKHHHSKITFRDEYTELLKKFEIEYKPQYLFDWADT